MDSSRQQTLTVLIGDDDVSMRRSVVDLLSERQELRILTVASGADAFASLLHETIDFLILDVEMPGMTGIEVLQRYLQGAWIAPTGGAPARPSRPRGMPTIFMSGNRDREIRRTCESLGRSFIDKPFQAQELRQAVDQILLELHR
ncbi:MAG: CheY-like chemotaxis protein [Pseudohongiellaceae bacterium]|jgi:CheY-like chemotaxis protein